MKGRSKRQGLIISDIFSKKCDSLEKHCPTLFMNPMRTAAAEWLPDVLATQLSMSGPTLKTGLTTRKVAKYRTWLL